MVTQTDRFRAPDRLIGNATVQDDFPPIDPADSVQLAARARGGDTASLEALLVRYQDRLRRVVRVRLGARLRASTDTMDIVQEALAVAARKVEDAELSSSAAILGWLARIAERKIHDAHDYFTAQRRDPGRERRLHLVVSGESMGWEPPAEQSSASHVAARSEAADIVDDALSEMSEDHREVIMQRHYLGADWDEVAASLGRSVAAVQELHRRAWERLREKVRPRLQDWLPEA